VRAGDERLGGQCIVRGELHTPCCSLYVAERARDDRRVLPGLSFEHPELRPRVSVERAVPIEVVGLEVEEDTDVRAQGVHVLELERRELAYDPRPVLDRADE